MEYQSNYWQRRLSRRRVLQATVVGGVGIAAAAIIGCDEEGTGSPQGPSQTGDAGREQPIRGGTLALVNEGAEQLPHLDVHQNSFGVLHGSGAGIAYSRLVMFDLNKYPAELAFTGDVAESWENPDPATWVFKLRRDVKWQNIAPVNGRPVGGQDVIYSFQRQQQESANAGIIAAFDKMEAMDDYTVRITTKRPDADFLYSVGDQRSKIVAKEAADLNGDLKQGPTIGSGPWILEEWVQEQNLRMRRNPDYYRIELPYADVYNRIVIPDIQTAQAAFRTGQILQVNTNGQITKLLNQSVPDLQVVDSKLLGVGGGVRLWMSPVNGPTRDVRVRQALSKLWTAM